MPGPLAGLTILDLTEYVCGPYATKLLADFGADVIKVERPGGDPARKLGPFPGGVSDPEKSGTFFYFNTNKRSIELDLASSEGKQTFLELLDRADAVVESFRPGRLDELDIGWDIIHARRPDVPLISISNFGQESPYRDYLGTELTLFALAGEMYTMGVMEREPVTMYGTAALVESGSAAASATFAAIFASKKQGIGQRVDFSIADSHFLGADRRHVGTIAFEFSGRRTKRASRNGRAALAGVYPCADGWVEFSAASNRMDRFSEMLGHPEWLQDPKWNIRATLLDPDHVAELEAYFFAWLSEHTKREIWEAARKAKVLCGPLFDVAEISADAHFRDRGFWATANHAKLGEVTFPGRPFIMPKTPWELRRPAPLAGRTRSRDSGRTFTYGAEVPNGAHAEPCAAPRRLTGHRPLRRLGRPLRDAAPRGPRRRSAQSRELARHATNDPRNHCSPFERVGRVATSCSWWLSQ